VPDALNHADPTASPDPLKTYASLSWGWLTGFRFTKIEVVQVAATGASFGDGLLHVGSGGCSGSPQNGGVACGKANRNRITLASFDADKNTVVVDVAPVFAQTDLTQMAECHSSGNACDSMFSALCIEFSNGQPKDGQTVFRVE
jgi:hypothetical protein